MEWTGARYADKPSVEVRIWIDAAPTRVWELVSDIGLMPAMSTELQSVEWLDGATGAATGARFAGRSRHEAMGEWEAVSHVVECEPERAFAWAIEDPAEPAALWRFRLEPKDGGTLVRISENPDGVFSPLAVLPPLQLFTKGRNAESLMRLEELALRRA